MTDSVYQRYVHRPKYKGEKSSKKSFGVIIFCAVVLGLGVLAFFIFGRKAEDTDFKSKVYMVSVAKYERLADANEQAEMVVRQGGAGFIFLNDYFHVVAFVYPKKDYAEDVVSRLASSGVRAEIIEVNVDFGKFDVARKNILKLYELAISYEKGEVTEVEILKIVREQKTNLAVQKSRKSVTEDERSVKILTENLKHFEDFEKNLNGKDTSGKLKLLVVRLISCGFK